VFFLTLQWKGKPSNSEEERKNPVPASFPQEGYGPLKRESGRETVLKKREGILEGKTSAGGESIILGERSLLLEEGSGATFFIMRERKRKRGESGSSLQFEEERGEEGFSRGEKGGDYLGRWQKKGKNVCKGIIAHPHGKGKKGGEGISVFPEKQRGTGGGKSKLDCATLRRRGEKKKGGAPASLQPEEEGGTPAKKGGKVVGGSDHAI